MFDLGWSELLVVAVVMILVVGPKELPGMLRTLGRSISSLRRMAGDFQRQLDDALHDAELDSLKNTIDDVKKLNPASHLKKSFNPIEQAVRDVNRDLNKKPSEQPKDAQSHAMQNDKAIEPKIDGKEGGVS